MNAKNFDAVFHLEFREDLKFWVETERKVAIRAFNIIEAVMRDPFGGIGKPEQLRHLAAGPGLAGSLKNIELYT
jgi:toxin YoeB